MSQTDDHDDPRRLPDGETPRATLLTVPNHHVGTDGGIWQPPEFDADKMFVAYMPNQHGEQMVYVHERGSETGLLYHGDMAWHEAEVEEGQVDMILEEAEVLFVMACWKAAIRGAW